MTYTLEQLTDRVIDAYGKLNPNAYPPTKSQKVRLAEFIKTHGWEEIKEIFSYLEESANGRGKKKGWSSGLWGIVANYEAWKNWGVNNTEWGAFNKMYSANYLEGFETFSCWEEEQLVKEFRRSQYQMSTHFPKELLDWARGIETKPKRTCPQIARVSQLINYY